MQDEILDQKKVRIEKLEKMREMGINPYPYRYERTHLSSELRQHSQELEGKEGIALAGRIVAKRGHGKTIFADIADSSGTLQVYFRKDTLDEKHFDLAKLIDIGDFIGVKGELFKTKTGELTILVKELEILAKSFFPLPEKWHGLKDVEIRYRQRYLDLVMNDEVKEIFTKRARIISTMRHILDAKGFVEVETPVLQPMYGGAFARPFTTHYNVLDRDYFLRISDELYLKRLIIGGLERVYEICKDFRNEGIDRSHCPEFTMMEVYQAYADYTDMMQLTEELICGVAQEISGSLKITFQDKQVNLQPPWKRLGFYEGLSDAIGQEVKDLSRDELYKLTEEQGLDVDEHANRGNLLDELFSEMVQPSIIDPTFIIDYPIEISPLAKQHRSHEGLVERFEPIVAGMEIGNAFSELNDPFEQRKRFEAQAKAREMGDGEAQMLDEDFLQAMEYGMPPTGGLGIGIDRIVMLLTDTPSIREVIIFPQLKSRE